MSTDNTTPLQPFEAHPELAKILLWFAHNVPIPGSKWQELVNQINKSVVTPSPASAHEQILQLLITGGFLDPGKLKEARDIIGKCAPSGSLEDSLSAYMKLQSKLAVWNLAITIANNECMRMSDDWNKDDQTEEAHAANECAKIIRGYIDNPVPELKSIVAPADEIDASISEGEEIDWDDVVRFVLSDQTYRNEGLSDRLKEKFQPNRHLILKNCLKIEP